MAERRALIIANSEYNKPFTGLLAPLHDAEELARVLKDPAIGAFDVQTLLNQEETTIRRAIERFFRGTVTKKDDLLLLYFSGHGVTDLEGHLHLCTKDTELERNEVVSSTAVSADFVNRAMRNSVSRRRVLILDCCHSGAVMKGWVQKGDSRLDMPFREQGTGSIVLTASKAAQFAFEKQTIDSLSSIQKSVYTALLVEGLETGKADRGGDGQVDIDELYEYLRENLPVYQTPTKSGYVEGGQLFLAKSRNVQPAPLPPDLIDDLETGDARKRRGAVIELADYLIGEHPGRALAARELLQKCHDSDDSRAIRKLARELLDKQGLKETPVHPELSATGLQPITQSAAFDRVVGETNPKTLESAAKPKPSGPPDLSDETISTDLRSAQRNHWFRWTIAGASLTAVSLLVYWLVLILGPTKSSLAWSALVHGPQPAVWSKCAKPEVVNNQFTSEDDSVWLYFSFLGRESGADEGLVQWVSPAGDEYLRNTFSLKPNESGCFRWYLDINGYPPSRLLGTWQALISYNGAQVGTQVFAIREEHSTEGSNPGGPLDLDPSDGLLVLKDGLKYVWVPPGRFTMGCSGDGQCQANENPQHEVTMSKGYWLGQNEVTQRAYELVVKKRPSYFKNFPDRPVENVTWNESMSYCKAVNSGLTLPTEAQWEYAARAGSKAARYRELLDDIAWYAGNSLKSTNDKLKVPNSWRLFNMLGNVWEWTSDWYETYDAGPTRDPQGPGSGNARVARGGSFGDDALKVRVSARYHLAARGEKSWRVTSGVL